MPKKRDWTSEPSCAHSPLPSIVSSQPVLSHRLPAYLGVTGALAGAFALCSLSLPEDAGASSHAHFRNLPRLSKDWQCSALAKRGGGRDPGSPFPKDRSLSAMHRSGRSWWGSSLSDVQLECRRPGRLRRFCHRGFASFTWGRW